MNLFVNVSAPSTNVSAPSTIDGRRTDANASSDAWDREHSAPQVMGLPDRRFKSTNMVAAVGQTLRPDIVARAAAHMGLDRILLERAFRAGVPGLLAALSALASRPSGLGPLYKAVSQQQLSSLTSLAGQLGADKRAVAVVVKGVTELTSLLGGGMMSALTCSVSRYAGLGTTASNRVLGLLGAIVLGMLEQQRRAKSLDAEELGQLIAAQDDYIARALPNCFAEDLRELGILPHSTGQHQQSASRA